MSSLDLNLRTPPYDIHVRYREVIEWDVTLYAWMESAAMYLQYAFILKLQLDILLSELQ